MNRWWRHGSGMTESSSGVSTWLWWLAAKIDRAVEVLEPVEARRPSAGPARSMAGRTTPSTRSTAGGAGRVRPGPVGVVVGPDLALGRQRLDAAGHGRRAQDPRHQAPPERDAAGLRRRRGHAAVHRQALEQLGGLLRGDGDAAHGSISSPGRSGDVGHEDGRVVEVGDRGVAADHVARPSPARPAGWRPA